MYTTDRAEQALDDIRKVFLLYERGIIDNGTAKDLTNRIVDLYVTDTVVPKPTGQSCKTCLYYFSGICKFNNSGLSVNPNDFCDNWFYGISADSTKE